MISIDCYGGQTFFKSEATGFFRLSRIGGQWWLITPDGNPFYSIGVSYTLSEGDYAPKLGYSPYKKNILEKYGSVESWVLETTRRFREWGFNTRGGWSSDEVKIPEFYLTFYTHKRWQKGIMMDFFSKEFFEYTDGVAKEETRPDDPLLTGYFLDNEMQWQTDWRRGPSMFDFYLRLPASSAGKKAFVEFFKTKYSTVEKMAEVWKPHLKNWDELYKLRKLSAKSGAALRATSDREEFTLTVARQYYKVTTEAIHRYDKNHLIAASRFISWTTPAVVITAAGEYCDLISINHYEIGPLVRFLLHFLKWWKPALAFAIGANDLSFADWYLLAGKPLIITEFSFRADDSGLPNTFPPSFINPTVPTQKVRAERYQQYVELWASQPFFVGYHWFRLMDEPKEGRWDGENGNYGLVNVEDKPYETFVSSVAKTNANVWKIHWQTKNTSVLDEAINQLRENYFAGKQSLEIQCADKSNILQTAACSFASSMLNTIQKRTKEVIISEKVKVYVSSGLLKELSEISESKLPLIGTGIPGIIFRVERAKKDNVEAFILKLWP